MQGIEGEGGGSSTRNEQVSLETGVVVSKWIRHV